MDVEKPPAVIDGARVLKYARVTDDVRPTGATRHTVGGVPFGPADALAVARYPDDASYYLFYLDANDETVTDTLHRSASDALAQAAHEYEGLNWTDVSDDL
jgi:hypothetical protein